LNLTGADIVVHFDPWWNPAAEAQATDRAHRIGQDKQVTVYKMITSNTVEEKVLGLQAGKRKLLEQIFEESEAAYLTLSVRELRELI
jgi:SNF2 family DNA or RNA helicase